MKEIIKNYYALANERKQIASLISKNIRFANTELAINRGRADQVNVQKQRYLTTRLNELDGLLREADEYIDRIPSPRERTILRLRFVEGMQWKQVAQVMDCSERNLFFIVNKFFKQQEVLETK